MKIMQIIPVFTMGGAETMCAGLCIQLKKMGHQVVAVSLSSEQTPLTRRLQEAGVDLRFLDKKLGSGLGCIPKLRKLILKERPQVIHTHLHALKYAALAFPKAPIVHTVHNEAAKEAVKLDQKIGKVLFHTGKATPVALSSLIQDSVTSLYGLPKDRVPVVLNGIDLSCCIPKADYGLHAPVRLIHVGRFSQQKNHEAILDALEELNNRGIPAQVTFYGEGDRMEEIRAQAVRRKLDGFTRFAGVTDNVFPHLEESDVFILPSRWEGIPMTVIEAMETGLPVIASDVGGLRDMIDSEKNGILIEPNGKALAQAVEELVKSEQLRKNLGTAARETAKKFSAEEMALRYEAIYQEKGK